MLVYNSCVRDARVLKEATTLAADGHVVTIIAVKDAQTALHEQRDAFRIVRIERDPPHYKLIRLLGRARHVRRVFLRPARIAEGIVRRRMALERPAGAASRPAPARPDRVRKALLVPHKPLMFGDFYIRAIRALGGIRPEAIHAHDLNTLLPAVITARRTGARVIYDAHELYPHISTLSRREARVWSVLERRLIGRADALLTVSPSLADQLTRSYGIPYPRVVFNGPDDEPAVTSEVPDLRTLAGVAHDARVVLYQGGFSPNRGLETLVRASADLRDAVLVLMGWGSLRDRLEELARDCPVRFVDPVDRSLLVPLAAQADLGVIPYEPVGLNNTLSAPNKLFDYLAAGLPVVASDLPELRRIVLGNHAGITFAPGSVPALTHALTELLDDPQRRETMRAAALAAAPAFAWARQAEELVQLYRGLDASLPQGGGAGW